jgi:hypothetical protein
VNTPKLSEESRHRQANAIARDLEASYGNSSAFNILDPDFLCLSMEHPPDSRIERMFGSRMLVRTRTAPRPRRLSPELDDALIQSLGEFRYKPAEDDIFKLLGTEHDAAAWLALSLIAPDRLARELLTKAQDKKLSGADRAEALNDLSELGSTNLVHDFIPLLEDTTTVNDGMPITRPGNEWRVCDHAAVAIARLLDRDESLSPYARLEQRQAFVQRAKEWANAEH